MLFLPFGFYFSTKGEKKSRNDGNKFRPNAESARRRGTQLFSINLGIFSFALFGATDFLTKCPFLVFSACFSPGALSPAARRNEQAVAGELCFLKTSPDLWWRALPMMLTLVNFNAQWWRVLPMMWYTIFSSISRNGCQKENKQKSMILKMIRNPTQRICLIQNILKWKDNSKKRNKRFHETSDGSLFKWLNLNFRYVAVGRHPKK